MTPHLRTRPRLALAAAMLLLLGNRSARADASYRITNLGGGSNSVPDADYVGLNNAGQLVGQTSLLQPGFALYSGYGPDPGVRTLAENQVFDPSSIDDAGQVAGGVDQPNGSGSAAIFSHGQVTDLGTLPGDHWAFATAINASGAVAGISVGPFDSSSIPNFPEHAFLWSGGSLQPLGTLPGFQESTANGLNDYGQVVGTAYQATVPNGPVGRSLGFVYDHGTLRALGTLGGDSSSASQINDAGQIVGTAALADGTSHAFLMTGGAMKDLGTLGGGNSTGAGINAAGEVVGWSQTASGVQHGFLFRDGTMIDLNDLLPPNSGWTIFSALRINAEGQILGSGFDRDGDYATLLLTPNNLPEPAPVPEPTTLAVIGSAALGLASRKWLRRSSANPSRR